MAKSNKISNDTGGLTKPSSVSLDNDLLHTPNRIEWRQRLIYSLKEWSKHPDSLSMVQFCSEYDIDRSALYAWAREYPDINKALENAKMLVGMHRDLGALKMTLNQKHVAWTLHTFDPEFDAANKYHAILKNIENENRSQPLTVIIKQADSVCTVPEIPKRGEE